MIIIETTTRERLVLVPEKQIVCTTHTRDATPEDLARGGFVLREQAAPGTLAHLRADLRDMTARAEKAEAHIKGLHLARPSEASAVAVLRELVAWDEAPTSCGIEFGPIADRARAVLAGAGPDPMPVVRAALRETEAEEEFFRAERMSEFLALPRQNLNEARAERRAAVEAYRKAGGK